ncbi:MAG TPA: OsmC family protein [Solirubrobacterales bacterium]|jgi:organic hydroperoxide reductase OsmC/OhrA|nr:OsmC family protein [Solirubrobacterales bacterium]
MEASIHRASVSWTGGDAGDITAHEVLLGAQSLPSSTAIEFGGDDSKSNPEMLLVGALSSCHMLWFLALARKKGFEVASYEDDAEAILDGKRFTSATLRPRVRWAGEPPPPEAIEDFHRRSHERCFIANSVDFPVEVAPQ